MIENLRGGMQGKISNLVPGIFGQFVLDVAREPRIVDDVEDVTHHTAGKIGSGYQ